MTDYLNTAILDAVTAAGAGAAVAGFCPATFQATGSTTDGAGAATILIEVSNDGVNFQTHQTITLTLSTTVSSAMYEMHAPYNYMRGNVTAISGTGAAVSLHMGV